MKKILLAIILGIISSYSLFAETDEVISPKQMEKYTQEHKKWLTASLSQLIAEVSKTQEVAEKLDKIDSYRKGIRKYFLNNDGHMLTDFRLEFRSLMDLYLAAFPSSKVFKSEDCSLYRSRFEEGAGKDREYYTWTAIEAEKMLNQVCVQK